MLVTQQPSLISYLRESYDDFGKRRFEGVNAFVALSRIITNILGDPYLRRTYLIIDALDECTTDLNLLLNFIHNLSKNSGVKWIVSSRNWQSIEKGLGKAAQKESLCLELNEKSVSAAVTTYIQFKVDWLAERNNYDDSTRNAVQVYLSSNAMGTFLWVALVCQELADISGWEAEEMLTTFPPGLDTLYKRMMDQICNAKKAKLCKSILAIVSTVYRPITLDELACFVDMPPRSIGNYNVLAEIIGLCGSFLTLRERTISFVHQSARDYIIEKASREIFPSGMEDVHHSIFLRSLQAMSSTLRRDVYRLGAPGFPIDRVKQPEPDPLAKVRYSCVYWVEHLVAGKNHSYDTQDGGTVENFLRNKYLYWLESLSLIGSISEGVLSLSNFIDFLQVRRDMFLYNMI
jgi:NACHT domain